MIEFPDLTEEIVEIVTNHNKINIKTTTNDVVEILIKKVIHGRNLLLILFIFVGNEIFSKSNRGGNSKWSDLTLTRHYNMTVVTF